MEIKEKINTMNQIQDKGMTEPNIDKFNRYRCYVQDLQKEINVYNEKYISTNNILFKKFIEYKFDEMMVYKCIIADLKIKINNDNVYS